MAKAKYVSFGMYWEEYGRQSVKLPENVNADDPEEVKAYIRSIWDDIGLPDGSYIQGSDELDEESVIMIEEEEE